MITIKNSLKVKLYIVVFTCILSCSFFINEAYDQYSDFTAFVKNHKTNYDGNLIHINYIVNNRNSIGY